MQLHLCRTKLKKQKPLTTLEKTDEGQLLFYILSHALTAISKGDDITEVGILTEGFKVRALSPH